MKPYFSAITALARDLSAKQDRLYCAIQSSIVNRLGISIGEFGIGEKGNTQPIYLPDGLEADVYYKSEDLHNRWAINSNGSFWTNVELFEMNRTNGEINGASRILSIYDLLEFIARLYMNLGIDTTEDVFIQIGHHNMNGTKLWKYSEMFMIYQDRICYSDNILIPSNTYRKIVLQKLQSEAAVIAAEFMNPVFMLYNGLQVPQSTYDRLLDYYRTGKLT